MNEFFKKMKASKTMHYLKIVSESATLALFLSIIFFAYEMIENMQESQKITDNLIKIQNSLTTRYLGEFPNFVPDINRLYAEANIGDTIVILEDVLFYGITSAPKDFYESNMRLLNLAANGSPVMIAYYNPQGMAYNFMIQELLLSQEHYKHYRDTLNLFNKRSSQYKHQKKQLINSGLANNVPKEEIDRRILALVDSCFGDIVGKEQLEKQKDLMLARSGGNISGEEKSKQADWNDFIQVRKILLERYFAQTRNDDKKSFKATVDKYRTSTLKQIDAATSTLTEIETRVMCQKMDSIRVTYLGKKGRSVDDITYTDFLNMFTGMTNVMRETYSRYPSITLVPIDDFFSVRSWLVCDKNGDSKAIMAFPSRYSSSEIGFYTTDETTRDYIKTMQQGIIVNYKHR